MRRRVVDVQVGPPGGENLGTAFEQAVREPVERVPRPVVARSSTRGRGRDPCRARRPRPGGWCGRLTALLGAAFAIWCRIGRQRRPERSARPEVPDAEAALARTHRRDHRHLASHTFDPSDRAGRAGNLGPGAPLILSLLHTDLQVSDEPLVQDRGIGAVGDTAPRTDAAVSRAEGYACTAPKAAQKALTMTPSFSTCLMPVSSNDEAPGRVGATCSAP